MASKSVFSSSPDYPRCVRCGLRPESILEYIYAANDLGVSPSEYVKREEGTYNKENGHFYCTDCYMLAGMPLGKAP